MLLAEGETHASKLDRNAPAPHPEQWREGALLPVALPRKRTVAFVIFHLCAGGAQRVVANAANALVDRNIDVHVLLLTQRRPVYQLDPRVKLHVVPATALGVLVAKLSARMRESSKQRADSDERSLSNLQTAPGLKHQSRGTFLRRSTYCMTKLVRAVLVPVVLSLSLGRRTFWIRSTLRAIKPDAVLAFLTQTSILTILATRGLGMRVVVSERNDPRRQIHRPRVLFLRKLVYGRADIVTANSRGALEPLADFVPKEKLAFLPNPLAWPEGTEVAQIEAPTMITVGRLVEQKGIDVLLAAWAKASPRLPGSRLAIVGDGPLRDQLQALARQLGIAERVDWYGQVEDPFPLLRAAKAFVMTSRFEGTPNALLEAMACGLPAIVSDASPGPCELVGEDEAAGLIVPVESAEATAAALVQLANDTQLRERLGVAAIERAREYEADRALATWLDLLGCA